MIEEHQTRATSSIRDWVDTADPDRATIHKAVRAAVVMPSVFLVADKVIANLQLALFAAFGSFALLVLTEVSGPRRARLSAFAALAVAGSVFVVLGTLCARQVVLATLAMALVAFVVLLAGAMSPLAAMTTTAALLTFILPVSIPAHGASAWARLAGWWLAVAVAVPAQMLIWPPQWHDRLREAMATALSTVRRSLVARAARHPDAELTDRALAAARAAVADLQLQFESTPFRPTNSAGRGLALAKVVDDLEWLRAASSADPGRAAVDSAFCPHQTREVWMAADQVLEAVPDVLRRSAGRIGPDDPGAAALSASLGRLRHARHTLSYDIRLSFTSEALDPAASARTSSELVDAVGASLNARRVANATELIARHVLMAAGLTTSTSPTGQSDPDDHSVAPAPGPAPDTGAGDGGIAGTPGDADHPLVLRPSAELESFANVRSVWFRAAARGAVGLALAVAVAQVFPVQHGFWVVLGTLSVLRSNAVGTGASALRALLGTLAGFVIAALVLAVIGHHPVLLWLALPVAVFMATVAPALISFTAGQAAFTVVVVVLFNLLDPNGWHVGLVRVEDVAIGCAISVVVGLLLWPRGASGAFGRVLGEALGVGSAYLLAAVEVTTGTQPSLDLRRPHLAALTADRRLDDGFRLFLTERAVQRVGLDVANRLVAGATRIRLAAFSLCTAAGTDRADVTALPAAAARAGHELCAAARASHHWYEQATGALGSPHGRLTEAPPVPDDLRSVVVDALDEARLHRRADLVTHALRLIWAERHLARQSQLQLDLADQAGHLLSLRRAWWS